ncbi:TetR family transcriptional regulator [Streptomyces nanshensis]|uniref:TetR family transcriptional regulator n=1 Tax=Streptomyces nanshensis TaxID=518642 RepID=A0A1E7L9B0_9ACTN|nr:TetR family transcriptional regulator [Streptomyces nanshensis]OEV12573.1 TetR family transcriptional regulator [Streptomyces nanshensis]
MTSGGRAEGPVRRRGRPASAAKAAGEPAAPDRILVSARTEFAERGYEKASIRAIARGAGVDSALVHHYFGTKEQVFTAAVEGAFAPALGIPDRLFSGSPEEWGEQLTRFVFRIWERAVTREPMLAILRSAVSNDTAAAVFRRLIARNLLERLAGGLGRPDAELRVELAMAQLVGTAMLRYVIKVEPIASAPPEVLIPRLAPVVQRHLTG